MPQGARVRVPSSPLMSPSLAEVVPREFETERRPDEFNGNAARLPVDLHKIGLAGNLLTSPGLNAVNVTLALLKRGDVRLGSLRAPRLTPLR